MCLRRPRMAAGVHLRSDFYVGDVHANKNFLDAGPSCPRMFKTVVSPGRIRIASRSATPLRFTNPSPPSGWIKDFHLQALDHARHTIKSPRQRRGLCKR